MRTGGRQRSSKLRVIIWIAVALLALLVLSSLAFDLLPMGTGSEEYARLWSKRFASIDSVSAARSAFSNVRVREFPNGEWIIVASDNSHGNPWGGTVVTKDSLGHVKTFYGHVCGRAYVGDGQSLNEIYATLSSWYGSTPAEGARKTARGD